jgi:UDP-glucose:O-linked fucose beta-1,3-glucosyltransferase
VNVIKRTWKRDDLLITFFSNVTDSSIPTVDTGVPNVERGHCVKSYAILEKAGTDKKYTGVLWTMLVDDDTLIRSNSPHCHMHIVLKLVRFQIGN